MLTGTLVEILIVLGTYVTGIAAVVNPIWNHLKGEYLKLSGKG